MFGTAVIVFREVFEAGLIIGIVAAALGHAPKALQYIWGGVVAGVAGSLLVAWMASQISNLFEGYGQELFNASILCLAVLMLAWHTLWMARSGRQMALDLKSLGLQAASGKKPMFAIATVVAVSVMREGSEIVLFLYGAVAASGATAIHALIGGIGGLMLGGMVSYVTYKGIVRIPMRWVFSVTTGLIALLASGMAAQAARFMQAAGAVTIMETEMWDWSNVLPDSGILGTFLKALMGYSDRPTALMLAAFVATMVLFIVANQLAKPKPKPAAV